jgi:hypothetical protein
MVTDIARHSGVRPPALAQTPAGSDDLHQRGVRGPSLDHTLGGYVDPSGRHFGLLPGGWQGGRRMVIDLDPSRGRTGNAIPVLGYRPGRDRDSPDL